jgi:hypothetical protein
MCTRFEAAKRNCILILQAEANEEDGAQQAKQIWITERKKMRKESARGLN